MKKFLAVIVAVFLIIAGVCLGVGFSYDYERIDTVYVNEVLQELQKGGTPQKIVYEYTWVDKSGNVKYSSIQVDEMPYETRISKAVGEGDLVVDFGEDRVIFYLRARERYYSMRNTLIWVVVVSFIVFAIATCIAMWIFYYRTVKPFNNLRKFASEVARGNLDSPLILDKYMSFGAFGEAFDIMRNNLRESRISEQNAMLAQSRLLQDIGHEIKTPLSTIQAVAECGKVVENNKNYDIILDKVNTIDNMVNNFYQKALEEEKQLNVYIVKHSVADLVDIIDGCDYSKRVSIGEVPSCNILYDKNRLTQIVENILANSIKYADTNIEVNMCEDGEFLRVSFRDFGEGVQAEQLSYIMERFYRGEKTEEKLGQGLGLNICRKLIMRMGGRMECANDNGFVVTLYLPIYKR